MGQPDLVIREAHPRSAIPADRIAQIPVFAINLGGQGETVRRQRAQFPKGRGSSGIGAPFDQAIQRADRWSGHPNCMAKQVILLRPSHSLGGRCAGDECRATSTFCLR